MWVLRKQNPKYKKVIFCEEAPSITSSPQKNSWKNLKYNSQSQKLLQKKKDKTETQHLLNEIRKRHTLLTVDSLAQQLNLITWPPTYPHTSQVSISTLRIDESTPNSCYHAVSLIHARLLSMSLPWPQPTNPTNLSAPNLTNNILTPNHFPYQ